MTRRVEIGGRIMMLEKPCVFQLVSSNFACQVDSAKDNTRVGVITQMLNAHTGSTQSVGGVPT